MDISQSIAPRQNRKGFGRHIVILVLAVVLLCIVAGVWLAGDPAFREKVAVKFGAPGEAAIGILADMYTSVSGQPPVPAVGAAAGTSLPGVPPHRNDPSGVSEDFERAMTEITVQEGGASVRGPVARGDATPQIGRKDDYVVRIAFIDDLAQWLRQGYAADGFGRLNVNLQEANLRYGIGMRGLAWIGEDLPAGREAALDRVYTRDMLNSLYAMYSDRFMEAVARTLEQPVGNRQLTARQKNAFYTLYARQFRGISGTLQGIAALPEFSARMNDLRRSAQHVVQANGRYSELVFARDMAQEQSEGAHLADLQKKVTEAGKIYQQAVVSREQTRDVLVAAIRKNGDVRPLDADTVLFVASWVDRRIRRHPDTMDATIQAGVIFRDLAKRFEAAGQAALKTEGE